MKAGRWFVGGLVALVGAIAFYPDLRYARELAAAKREGLWTTPAEVRTAAGMTPVEKTPAAQVERARQEERRLGGTVSPDYPAVSAVVDGTATAFDRKQAHKALVGLEPNLAAWREASRYAALAPDRNYEDGFGTIYREFGPARGAALRLSAAAQLGLSPEENLLSAARLCALIRREPGLVPAAAGTDLAQKTLAAAQKLDLAAPIEAALGPASEVRRVLGPELPAFLQSMEYGRYTAGLSVLGVPDGATWVEKATHYGPFARNTKAAGIAQWRTLWARLPKDDRDYEGAAKVMDVELPKLDLLMPSYADVMGKLFSVPGDPGRGAVLRSVAKLERERAKVRAAR